MRAMVCIIVVPDSDCCIYVLSVCQMASVLSIQFDLVPRDSALVCSWILPRDFALICSCSSKTSVKFNDRYVLEQWRQVRQTRLSHQSNLHSKAMESLAPVVQHNMGCHRRAASCSKRKCDAERVHFHFDSDPNLSVSREKYALSMESKDPRSK